MYILAYANYAHIFAPINIGFTELIKPRGYVSNNTNGDHQLT